MKIPGMGFLAWAFGDKGIVRPAGFDGGKMGRRLRAIPSVQGAVDSLIRRYGKNLLGRARYLCVNNPYMASAKDYWVSSLVSDGIKPSFLMPDAAMKKAVQQVWRDWTDQADADNTTDFYGLEYLIGCELFEAGECFVRIRPRRKADGVIVPMQLQLLPSEMVPIDYNDIRGATGVARIESGIEFDSIGRRVAYHIYKQHPGNDFQMQGLNNSPASFYNTTRVPADQILHIRIPHRAGQIRAISRITPSIITMAMLDLYDDAELERKRTAALFAGFVTTDLGDGDEANPLGVLTGHPGEPASYSLEPGIMAELKPGQDIKFAEPADVGGNYDSFEYRNLTKGNAGMGVTYAGGTGDLKGANFGSIRAGTIDSKRRISALQNHFLIFQFCRPVICKWMEAAVLYGAVPISPELYINAPLDYQRCKWIASKWDWIDPLKDMQADALAVDKGFKARSDVVEESGEDVEELDERIAADKTRADKLGLVFAAGTGNNAPGNQPPEKDSEAETGSE